MLLSASPCASSPSSEPGPSVPPPDSPLPTLPLGSRGSSAPRCSPTRTVLPSTVAVCLYRVRAYVDSCWG